MKAKKFTLSLLLSIALGVSSFSQTGYAIRKSSETDDISSNNTIFLPKENYEFSDLSNLKIETERLIITPTNENDLDKLAEYLQNPQVTQYFAVKTSESFLPQFVQNIASSSNLLPQFLQNIVFSSSNIT